MASYVGIDLHRRRSVIVVMDEAGEVVSSTRIENSRLNLEVELRAIVDAAGDEPVEVATCCGWAGCLRRGWRRERSGSCGNWSAIAGSSRSCSRG